MFVLRGVTGRTGGHDHGTLVGGDSQTGVGFTGGFPEIMSHLPRRTEREFGVPFPGEILPADQWAQTALKKMPDGRLNWAELFGRTAPVVLDLGCGNGRFLIGSAVARKTHDHFGTDVLPVVIRYARKRGNQRGLANMRFAVLGAHELLERYVEPGSVTEIHCYHPQPYYEPGQVHRRLVTPTFLALVHRCLIPGGLFVVQTDNPGYWKYIRAVAPVFFDFHERIGRWQDAPKGRTRREIVAMKKNLPVFRGSGTAKVGLSEDEAIKLAESLPSPIFDADRRLRDLDEMG
ncbi:tRNA (guanine(46)-N(7))-methyltransferase TrmB [Fimbriiglobus ruber]|uniref:tRNA (guanine(46)-N(7))-methyltransferase n=1 Tax=Fimbriiglobus ruber TaxID=1908690 RepID=A0A225D4H1_9BACT|nr:methyltransferase domain-containing protein [Fimbriiglobus ruber]OWK36480.1 tRNA (guanine46-N7-)-methyltransferase [Fimbriiglobus ruber]